MGDSGRQWETVGDGGRWWETVGDDTMSSVLVLAQDGRTAPLRTLMLAQKKDAIIPLTLTN